MKDDYRSLYLFWLDSSGVGLVDLHLTKKEWSQDQIIHQGSRKLGLLKSEEQQEGLRKD